MTRLFNHVCTRASIPFADAFLVFPAPLPRVTEAGETRVLLALCVLQSDGEKSALGKWWKSLTLVTFCTWFAIIFLVVRGLPSLFLILLSCPRACASCEANLMHRSFMPGSLWSRSCARLANLAFLTLWTLPRCSRPQPPLSIPVSLSSLRHQMSVRIRARWQDDFYRPTTNHQLQALR
jgi:hypothetical protein